MSWPADPEPPTWDDARHIYEDARDDVAHALRDAQADGDTERADYLGQRLRDVKRASGRLGRWGE